MVLKAILTILKQDSTYTFCAADIPIYSTSNLKCFKTRFIFMRIILNLLLSQESTVGNISSQYIYKPGFACNFFP